MKKIKIVTGPNTRSLSLHNIPIRTELGRELHRKFLPAPGDLVIFMDYSQIELRILASMIKRI